MTDSPNWATVYPELLLLGMACVIALFDLVVKTPLRGSTYRLTLLTLGVVAVLEAMLATSGEILHGFGGMVVSDPIVADIMPAAPGNGKKGARTVAVAAFILSIFPRLTTPARAAEKAAYSRQSFAFIIKTS